MGHVLLAELGSQVVGLADGAEFREDAVKVRVGKVQMGLVQAEGFDVQVVAVRNGKALLLADGPHPAPLAEVEAVLQGSHGVLVRRPGRAGPARWCGIGLSWSLSEGHDGRSTREARPIRGLAGGHRSR